MQIASLVLFCLVHGSGDGCAKKEEKPAGGYFKVEACGILRATGAIRVETSAGGGYYYRSSGVEIQTPHLSIEVHFFGSKEPADLAAKFPGRRVVVMGALMTVPGEPIWGISGPRPKTILRATAIKLTDAP